MENKQRLFIGKQKISDLDIDFVAIDVETSNSFHICQIAIIVVEHGYMTKIYQTLVKPHENKYNWHCTRVHGIHAKHTMTAPTFQQIYPEIKELLAGKKLVAHNEAFDRTTLQKIMNFCGFDYSDLQQTSKNFECTHKLFKGKFESTKLSFLCEYYKINLQHHDATSDAIACAQLYAIHLQDVEDKKLMEKI